MNITKDTTLFLETLESTDYHVAEGANLTIVALLTEGWEEKAYLNFYLESENSEVYFNAIILGKGENSFPFETISHHPTTNTKGFYYTRSVLFDKSRVDYRGNLVIPKEGQMTDCYLSHDTLMLSPDAKTITIPCLEIEADDVTAGHAATVGRVDEELLFYLQSRGIGKSQAQEMLIRGFLQGDLNKINDEEIRQKVSEKIEALV